MYAPDRQHIVILCLKRIGRCRVHDQTAGECLHCDESHVRFLAERYQTLVLLRRQIAERKLQRLVQSGGDRLLCHLQTVIRDTDMTDLSLRLCLEHALIQPASVPRFWTECRLVELIDINIVCAQIRQ